jgi:hypothetical protein
MYTFAILTKGDQLVNYHCDTEKTARILDVPDGVVDRIPCDDEIYVSIG